MSESLESINAKLTVSQKKIAALEEAVKPRKRKRGGITVENLGTHLVTTHEILRALQAMENENTGNNEDGVDVEAPNDGGNDPFDSVAVL